VGFTVGLCIVGMVSGVVASVMVQGRRSTVRAVATPNDGEALPSSSSSPMGSASAPGSAPSAATGSSAGSAAVDPPAAEGKFVKTIQVRLDAPPASVQFSADESQLFVLAEDGTLRAHDVATGVEKRRVKLPGRGKSLKSLSGGQVAVLGLPAELLVIDEAGWAAGNPPAQFQKHAAVRDVVDVVAVGEPMKVVVLTGQGARVVRLSSDFSTIESEFVSVPPVLSLATMRAGGVERLVMLVPSRPPVDSGSVVLCDPMSDPFGASRATWSGVTDPRVSDRVGSDKLLLFDAATATMIDFSVEGERRAAPTGSQPFAAFRWVGDRAIVIGAGGEATLVSFGGRAGLSPVSLGGIPSAAVATPDRRVAVVALGGGIRGRGAKTVVLGGEPLAVESTVETGEGSHILTIAPKGAVIAVGAIAGRTVTLLARQ
jgi:hypothetical protein